jgi:hypothetical protein
MALRGITVRPSARVTPPAHACFEPSRDAYAVTVTTSRLDTMPSVTQNWMVVTAPERLLTDGKSYAFSVKDVTDSCAFGYFSDLSRRHHLRRTGHPVDPFDSHNLFARLDCR